MYHFFVPAENISDSQVVITGGDFNHIKNVLRMKPNEKFIANDGNGASYCCSIREFVGDIVVADIEKGQLESSELPVRLVLFQYRQQRCLRQIHESNSNSLPRCRRWQ